MRRLYAWLLLTVSACQWIGGHICFEVRHFVHVPQIMSKVEETISNDIYEETGIEASVSILPENQNVRWGTDYGNYFAFSKSDSIGTVYYTIDYAPRSTTWEDISDCPAKPLNDDTAQTNLLKSLFSEFLFPCSIVLSKKVEELAVLNFSKQHSFKNNFQASPLSPPPDFYY